MYSPFVGDQKFGQGARLIKHVRGLATEQVSCTYLGQVQTTYNPISFAYVCDTESSFDNPAIEATPWDKSIAFRSLALFSCEQDVDSFQRYAADLNQDLVVLHLRWSGCVRCERDDGYRALL